MSRCRGRGWAVHALVALSLIPVPAAWAGQAPIWHSPNVRPASPPAVSRSLSGRLGDLAHGRHFDRHGTPPAYPFLAALSSPPTTLARIESGYLVFPAGGSRIPLRTPSLPAGAVPTPPVLQAMPDGRWVLVVFPYYLPPSSEMHHRVEVFAADGSHAGGFGSRPTHALRAASHVAVARDRVIQSTGYCEGMRWSIRVYDLVRMGVLEFACPEGQCGDALFASLGPTGHLLIALEAVEETPSPVRIVETRLWILDGGGALASSGVFASVDPGTVGGAPAGGCAAAETVAARSAVAIHTLQSVEPLPDRAGWRVRFADPSGVREYDLAGQWSGQGRDLVR